MNASHLGKSRHAAIGAFEAHFGTRVRTTSPNPTNVWLAELHDDYGEFAFRVSATGDSEDGALSRLDALLTEIAQSLRDPVSSELYARPPYCAGEVELHLRCPMVLVEPTDGQAIRVWRCPRCLCVWQEETAHAS